MTIFTIASTTAPKKAAQKPVTVNPESNEDANISISALVTRRNMPNVRIESGIVMIFKNSPIEAFMSPITTAAIKADPKL